MIPQQTAMAARLPLAICCAAMSAFLPLLGALCVTLALTDEGDSGLHRQPSNEFTLSKSTSDIASPSSLQAIEAFREDMRMHEAAQRSAESSMQARVRSLEDDISNEQAARPRDAVLIAVSTVDIASLGVDWAARTSGATIDHGSTSPALGLGLSGSMSRAVAAALPRYKSHVGMVSHGPEEVLAADAAPPSRCFAFEGNGTVAVRLLRPLAPTRVVVERLADPWAQAPLSSPRDVEVLAKLEGASSYSESLGAFEYLLEGPSAQVFFLQVHSRPVRALLFRFGSNWGAAHTSVCRLRIFAPDNNRHKLDLPGRQGQ